MIATLALFVQSVCGGDGEPVHPAKELFKECEAVRALAGKAQPYTYVAENALAIKACREKLIAYTKTHEGDDLDGLNWANSFRSIYSISASREWRTYAESEANVRAVWEIIAQIKLDNPEKMADVALEVARWHIEEWSKRDPEASAAFMDETQMKYMGKLSQSGLELWKFSIPGFEENFMMAAKSLPPERRAAFVRQREAGIIRHLQDESISVNTRSEQLAAYANQLYGQGESDRAATLLDAWWAKYGELIQTAHFYSERFHIACYGCGDWVKACESLRRMDRLVVTGAIRADDDLYRLVVTNYYKNIGYPEYEMKRRAVIFNADVRKEASSTIQK